MVKSFGVLVAVPFFLLILHIVDVSTTKTERYFVDSGRPQIDDSSSVRIVKLREKRDATTDVKNQYDSIPAQPTGNVDALKTTATATATVVMPSISGVALNDSTPGAVPYRTDNQQLLGVNGTGQRRDDLIKPTVVSEPLLPTATAKDNPELKKPNQLPKKVGATLYAPQTSGDDSGLDEIIDSVDVPEDDTINAIKKQNFTVVYTTDHHSYYNSSFYMNKAEADEIWSKIKDIPPNDMLSNSHRRAMTVALKFVFPFYGHNITNVTVASGGFLYTGEYVHSWLAATQYIAPLMANFDTSLSNNSFVRLNDNGTALTVVWENVSLQDKPNVGNFTFSATLHQSGDIVFTYFNIPLAISAIQNANHPVKVGLSDAYIIDKVVYYTRRKTIYEYHRVNFANTEIANGTIIRLTALNTCLEYTDCASCINHKTTFDCTWCPTLNRCSTGTDRKKQEWLTRGCDRTQITNLSSCPAVQKENSAEKTNDGNTNASNTESGGHSIHGDDDIDDAHKSFHHTDTTNEAAIMPVDTNNNLNKDVNASAVNAKPTEPKSVGLAFGVIVPLCLVVTILLWVLYAYRNPHTKSGQLLIQYRPKQWSWRRGEARYTAATIHM